MVDNWTEDGEMFEDAGDVGGDVQAGAAFDRRFYYRPDPESREGAVVTVVYYPVYGTGDDPMNNGLENGPFSVQRQAQYTLCGDVFEPGDTESWSDLRYTLMSGPYATVEAAEKTARALSLEFTPNRILWDGASTEIPEINDADL